MDNPRYLVNISYNPSRAIGQQEINYSGITYSMPTYSSGEFIASMPEMKISATGTSYPEALDNLLLIATASSTIGPGNPPIGDARTW